jgi:hypothetical protein
VKATGACYEFIVNTKGGAIIAENLLSSGVTVRDTAEWGRKAYLRKLSGVRYATEVHWSYCFHDNSTVRNLRVYGAHNIVNDVTVLLVARAFKNAKQEKLTPWPVASFDAASAEVRRS